METNLYSRTRVAEYLGISLSQFDEIRKRDFPAPIMIGKFPRWQETDIQQWTARQRLNTLMKASGDAATDTTDSN